LEDLGNSLAGGVTGIEANRHAEANIPQALAVF